VSPQTGDRKKKAASSPKANDVAGDRSMIIDFHAHVFPPDICADRTECLRLDPTFALLYAEPNSRLAAAEDLLRSMDEAGIDASVIVNFAWRDPDLCRRTNDYILESAASSNGRLIPFGLFAPGPGAREEVERCIRLGLRGLGELRPENQGYDLDSTSESALLAEAAGHHLPLLFHTTEPVGHDYPGKEGQPIDSLYRFIERAPQATVVASHWGGGLPFYSLLRRGHPVLANTYFDTAASRFLYRHEVFRHVVDIIGAEHVLFGTDFPLLSQSRCRKEIEDAPLSDEEKRLVLGGNAQRLLNLPVVP
jgi:predicted TIM-barrel fold metal-dependent hydrolase